MWNLWAWEGSWRVLASYETAVEALRARVAHGVPWADAAVTRAGSKADRHIRANVTDHEAPWS